MKSLQLPVHQNEIKSSVAKDDKESNTRIEEMAWAKLATEISEAIFFKCLQVTTRIRRIPFPKRLHGEMREAPPRKSSPYCSQRLKLKSHFCPLIKFVLKFSVFQLYYQGTVLQHKNPTNGKPQLPMVLHTPACIYSFASRGKPKTQKLKSCQSIQLSRAYS